MMFRGVQQDYPWGVKNTFKCKKRRNEKTEDPKGQAGLSDPKAPSTPTVVE
jgi:hypothetical protein